MLRRYGCEEKWGIGSGWEEVPMDTNVGFWTFAALIGARRVDQKRGCGGVQIWTLGNAV